MHQFRTLWGVDAREVEHADAVALWSPNRSASAAIDGGISEKMFASVQPHGSEFGERSADGGGANRLLGQVHTHACNGFYPFVVAVYAATHIQNNALGVSQQCKKRGACNGAAQALYFRLCSLDKITLKIECAGNVCSRYRIKSHAVVRV